MANGLQSARETLQRLDRERLREEQLAVEWERRAVRAVQAGNDDLARQALLRKIEHAKLALGAEQQAVRQRALIDALASEPPGAPATSAVVPAGAPPRALDVAFEVRLEEIALRVEALERESLDAMRAARSKLGPDLDEIRKNDDDGSGGHGLQPYVWAQTRSGLR